MSGTPDTAATEPPSQERSSPETTENKPSSPIGNSPVTTESESLSQIIGSSLVSLENEPPSLKGISPVTTENESFSNMGGGTSSSTNESEKPFEVSAETKQHNGDVRKFISVLKRISSSRIIIFIIADSSEECETSS